MTHIIPLPALTIGQSTLIDLAGQPILVCRTPSGLVALNAICPHQEKTLEGCRIRSTTLMCPHHGARFNLETGASLSPMLTPNPLTLYPCREAGDTLEIDL